MPLLLQQPQRKKSVLLIGDSMIKAIEEQQLSKFQSIEKICIGGAKIDIIKDQLITELRQCRHDHVIFHAGINNLAESQPDGIVTCHNFKADNNCLGPCHFIYIQHNKKINKHPFLYMSSSSHVRVIRYAQNKVPTAEGRNET